MIKRLMDITGAIIGLTIFGLPMILIALWIKRDSKGGVFFVQERLGRDIVPYKMYKFRTMVANAEQMGTGLFSYDDDDRITRVGHFLRKTSLDELPQFFNILNGSMALVGPRPPVTYELGDVADFTPEMKRRFRMKPGVTGLAQVSGRNELDWPQKIVFDNQYIDLFARWGVLIDLRIILQTIWVVLSRKSTIEKRKQEQS
jgi:lipopolysaccharide/colanic/teichoic acid biosynthesis glycosyltransferase